MARKLANLTLAQITQDFLPEHWKDWTDEEKKHLGNVEEMGKIIKSHLQNAGCEIEEMYAIKHDKDEKKLWNEYKMAYEVQFTSNHAHFVIKFKKDKGKTLPELASAVGVEENYIEKPRSGRYAYDNMLSYLIHIKYDKKYQYDVHSVYTLAGRDYVEHYREKYESWLKGRAKRSLQSAKELSDFLVNGIADGNIEFKDIAMDDEWKKAYILFSNKIDRALNAKLKADQTYRSETNKQKKKQGTVPTT